MSNDLISRQAAIDIINVYAERFNGYIGTPNDSEVYAYARGLLLSIERNIRALPSVEPEQRWISSGKKPPKEGSYLVWMPFALPERRITVAEYCGGYWNIKTPISAWMPLPEPYKGD